jgi:hypothetical protein
VRVLLDGTPVLEGTYLVGWPTEHWPALQHPAKRYSLQRLGDFVIQPEPGNPDVAVLRGDIVIRFQALHREEETKVSELRLVAGETAPRTRGWYIDPDWIEDTIFGTRTRVWIAASIVGVVLAFVCLLAGYWWPPARKWVQGLALVALFLSSGALLAPPLLKWPGPVGFPQTVLLVLQVAGIVLASIAVLRWKRGIRIMSRCSNHQARP